MARVWQYFDKNFAKPLLTHDTPSLMQTCSDCCLPIARLFSSERQIHAEKEYEDVFYEQNSDELDCSTNNEESFNLLPRKQKSSD